MNTLARQCQVEDILLDVDIQNRNQLFDLVAQHLHRRHGLEEDGVADHLSKREQLGSTALGQGVAIPHARIRQLQDPVVTYVHTAQPIPFDAPDGKPVSDFFLLLVPEQATQVHLQLLADAAALLCERGFRDALRAAASALDVRRLLLDWNRT